MKQVTIDHHKIPEDRLVNLMKATSHSYLNAPFSSEAKSCPIILFSPGYLTPPQSYTSIIEDLASHGFIVLAVSHTKFPPDESEIKMNKGEFHKEWEDTLEYLISELPNLKTSFNFMKFADVSRVGLVGHSFGGSASLHVCERTQGCKTAINIDGFLHGKRKLKSLHKPSLALMAVNSSNTSPLSEEEKTLEAELISLFKSAKGMGQSKYIEIDRMHHFSFADSWVFLPHAAQKESTVSGAVGIEIARKSILWFLDKALRKGKAPFPSQKKFPQVSFQAPFKQAQDLELPIVLVGAMGVGKTTVGRILANKLNLLHVPSDKYRWGYFIEDGYSENEERKLSPTSEKISYEKRFQMKAIPRILSDYPKSVIDIGFYGSDYLSNEENMVFEGIKHVVNLEFDPDDEASLRESIRRMKIRNNGEHPSRVEIEFNKTLINTINIPGQTTIYTLGKSPEQVANEIFERLR